MHSTYESAIRRAFRNELRIHKPVKLSHLFDFAYEEKLGERKENEFCRVFVRRYDGSYKLNPAEIDSVKFMTAGELKSFVAKNPIKATKWLRETISRM